MSNPFVDDLTLALVCAILALAALVVACAAFVWTRALVQLQQLRLSMYQVDATVNAPNDATSTTGSDETADDMEPIKYEQPEPVDLDGLSFVAEAAVRSRRRKAGGAKDDDARTTDENAGIKEEMIEPVGGTRLFRNGAHGG